jgi:two-component system response regulator (stage 0 sporulation protein F)
MKTVLIVDDESEIVDFLSNFLGRFKINSLKALNAKKAIEVFNQYRPEWVFLDIKMPDKDGLEVLKELKKIDSKVKVIMITAKEDKESQQKAKRLGVVDYFIKPLDLEELHKKIKNYIL